VPAKEAQHEVSTYELDARALTVEYEALIRENSHPYLIHTAKARASAQRPWVAVIVIGDHVMCFPACYTRKGLRRSLRKVYRKAGIRDRLRASDATNLFTASHEQLNHSEMAGLLAMMMRMGAGESC
jgi:hypothetical protein